MTSVWKGKTMRNLGGGRCYLSIWFEGGWPLSIPRLILDRQ